MTTATGKFLGRMSRGEQIKSSVIQGHVNDEPDITVRDARDIW